MPVGSGSIRLQWLLPIDLPPLFVCLLACVGGACIGSFLNVCIYRLPLEESVVSPGSHCRSCATPLAWYDNIPLFTYLVRRGRCRVCGARFSARYFWVELLTAAIAGLLVVRFGVSLVTLGYFVFAAALVVITFIDTDYKIIPDVISLPGIILGLLFSAISAHLTFWESLTGAGLGAGVLLAVACGYWAVTRREGLGGGDIKLLAMIGAFLGWRAIPFTLLLASCTGSAVGIATMLRRRADSKLVLPFGPFLAFGAGCYLFIGESLIAWYLDLR